MASARLQVALAAGLRLGGPARILAALREGGIDALEQAAANDDPEIVDQAAVSAAQLGREGVGVVFLGDQAYPARLESLKSPPPILYYRGNPELFDWPSVGMCGARAASAKGLDAARIAGAAVARAGLAVVSGNAKGVDTETHLAAIREGGNTVIVLAEGIAGFRPRTAHHEAGLDWGRTLVISQFPPHQGWTVGGAMTRNVIIAGLGVALVVIEAGEKGGTLDAGLKALELHRPVLALGFRTGLPAGNTLLLSRGAMRVSSTGELIGAIQEIQQSVAGGQLPLFAELTASR